MIGHLYTLLLAPHGPVVEPEAPSAHAGTLSGGGSLARAKRGRNRFHDELTDDDLMQMAIGLITSGVLECL